MSYPSGPPGGQPGGYPGQPPQQGPVFGQPPAAPNPLGGLGVPGLLTLGVLVFALAAYFCSFGGGYGLEVLLLLAGGLLAGLTLLPRTPNLLPFAAVLSIIGGLGMLSYVINLSSGGLATTIILILVFGLLQALAAVGALLLEHGVIKLAPRPAVPHPAQNYQPGGYPPPGGPHHQQPAPQHQQATTYLGGPQSAPPPAPQSGPQSTQFLQHPGQISHPHTPPGGNGNE